MDAVRDEFDIPIIGVIVPGARAAVEATANGEIGVVGTDATVKSGTYTKVIHQMDPNIHVREKACPLFVPLVEEGFKEHVVTEEVIEYYLESLKHTEIDAMILGCTIIRFYVPRSVLIWENESRSSIRPMRPHGSQTASSE